MKKLTALLLFSFLAAVSVRADVIWQDTFNYADGSVTTNSGGVWARHSGTATAPGDALVKGHRLENSATGGTVSRQDDVHRNFDGYTNSVIPVYASFIVNCTNLPNAAGTYFAHFATNATIFYGRLFALVGTNLCQPNTWRLAISASSSTINQIFPVDLAMNQDYQVVVGWDPASTWQATLWVNPISPASFSTLSSDTVSAQPCPAISYCFRQASSFGSWFCTISNLVAATTFSEAATNVWATNAVPPSVVYQPKGVTNFVGAAISLAAVATGQGLGDLTYRWQQGGVDRPGATANILTISSAAASDSGNYTLIVTTPYGLTATSSVAKVLISAAPVPPSFVTQPVSQTVYKGQTVVLSTTVVSPGNVFYTWYSNNVVVAAGVNSSGQTSTLELDNVTTNFAASYKVAATNDIVPTQGIVSTNAVLTVINPLQVTIAYLRTLVDPLNGYMPTNNLTIPYQVTGIITTYTNTTTGDTFSYYLQDGTGGIDIFGTFGSTFRPQLGDVVTYVGVLSGYATGLELYSDTTTRPYTSYVVLSNNIAGLPAPLPVSFGVTSNLDNMNYNIAGLLVKLSDVYFGTNAGTIITNHIITVTNSAGQKFQLQTFALDQDTLGQTFPVHAYSVSGVMYGMNTNFTLAVTRFADIVTTASSPIPLSLGYAGGILTFTWSDASFVLQSSAIVTGPYTTIPGASSGFTTNATSHPAMFFRLYHP
jgi:hypothetical protein